MNEIRFIREDELDQLVALCEMHAIYERCEYSKEGKAELLRQAIFNSPKSLHCIVAVEHDCIIGYATYMEQYSTWDAKHYIYLDCIFLEDKARSRGIGEDLMNFVYKECENKGIGHIQWQTPDFNTRAIKFYKRIGAVSKSKERFFWTINP